MTNHSALRAAIVGLPTLIGACADGSTNVAHALRSATIAFVVEMKAAPVRIGYPTQQFELRVQPYYERTAGGPMPISALSVVPLGTVPSHRAPAQIVLDASACASDPSRTPGGAGCPVRLDIKLFLANGGLILDHQYLGPWPVSGSRLTLSDTLRITEVGVPDVFPRSPTIVIGASVRMSARFVTVTGDTVSRPVVWRSEAPSVATVDALGIVTGLKAGSAGVVASFGHGQSANGQLVVVRAP